MLENKKKMPGIKEEQVDQNCMESTVAEQTVDM